MGKKNNAFINTLGDLSCDIYTHLGGLNFDEKDFQIAMGYEFSKLGIDYLRETHLELYYKEVPIKLGAPDFFLNALRPPLIIEVKLAREISNIFRQQLKMYLMSIKKNPKSVFKKVTTGILINFLKEDPTTFEEVEVNRKKDLYKVEIEKFTLDKNDQLKLLEKKSLQKI